MQNENQIQLASLETLFSVGYNHTASSLLVKSCPAVYLYLHTHIFLSILKDYFVYYIGR